MPYTTPVTDRTLADIAAKNSKAYMNVADWNRIYRNAQIVSLLTENMVNEAVDYNFIATPSIVTIHEFMLGMVNTIASNIENIRLAVMADGMGGMGSEIKDDWTAGANAQSPKFDFFNLLEKTIDLVWNYYDGGSIDIYPTLASDLVITNEDVMYVDGIDANGYNIELSGTANLYIL